MTPTRTDILERAAALDLVRVRWKLVADLCGCSVTTVRRVVDGSPLASDDARRRVLTALGFQPHELENLDHD